MNKLLKGIIGFSLKNRYFILFCAVILVIAGVITYKDMPIEAFPDVTNTEISVITQWPGRSAEEVEKFITIPIEIAMNPVQKKVSLRSTTIFGLSYVKLIFDDNVKDPEASTGDEPAAKCHPSTQCATLRATTHRAHWRNIPLYPEKQSA